MSLKPAFRATVNSRANDNDDLQKLFNLFAQLGNDSDSTSVSAADLQNAFWVGVNRTRFLTKEKAEACITQYDQSNDSTWNFEEWKTFHEWIIQGWPETWEAIFLTRDNDTICYDMGVDFEYERFLYFASHDGVSGTLSAEDFTKIFTYMSVAKAEACIAKFQITSEEMSWDYDEWKGFLAWYEKNYPHSAYRMFFTRDNEDYCYPDF